MPKQFIHVTRVSVYNFLKNWVFYTYIAEHSMLPYTLCITPQFVRHNEFARKDGQREHWYTHPGLEKA